MTLERTQEERDARMFPGTIHVFELAASIHGLRAEGEYERSGRNGITLSKNAGLRVVLEVLRAGASLGRHRAPGPITVQVLEGELRFEGEDSVAYLRRGELLTLPSRQTHAVEAVRDAAFLISIAPEPHKTEEPSPEADLGEIRGAAPSDGAAPETTMDEEHHAVALARDRARRAVDDFRRHPAPDTRFEVVNEVEAFADHLFRHFAYEEQEGFLQPELERRPAADREARLLLEEHAQMRADLRELTRDLETRLDRTDEPERTAIILEGLSNRLHQHELRENALAMDVFWTEDGEGD